VLNRLAQEVKDASFINTPTKLIGNTLATNEIILHYNGSAQLTRIDTTGPDAQGRYSLRIARGQRVVPAGISWSSPATVLEDLTSDQIFTLREQDSKPLYEIINSVVPAVPSEKYKYVSITLSHHSPDLQKTITHTVGVNVSQEFFLIYVDMVGFNPAYEDGSSGFPYNDLWTALSISDDYDNTRNWPGDYIIVKNGNYTLPPIGRFFDHSSYYL
jgi:hypothetical protein